MPATLTVSKCGQSRMRGRLSFADVCRGAAANHIGPIWQHFLLGDREIDVLQVILDEIGHGGLTLAIGAAVGVDTWNADQFLE